MSGDLTPTGSPGGFFFLDRNRQIANGNAEKLTGNWWGGLAFGEAPATGDTTGENSQPTTANPGSSVQTLGDYSTVQQRLAEATATNGDAASGVAGLAGRWSGRAAEPGGAPFPVEFDITSDCAMNKTCGTIAVPAVPCRGRLTLIDSRPEGFEFNVDDFDDASDKSVCQPGAGEVVKALSDGTLSYTATYSGATGILRRIQ